jgi:predicted enzyme related to lactoylglutathione lyase
MKELIINIDVPDLKAGIDFYSSGLGFECVRKLFQDSVAELRCDAGNTFLIEQPDGSRPVPDNSAQRHYSPHWTPVHLDVPVTDLDEAVARASAAGASVSGPLASHVFGRLAPMRDPFGHGFCLIEFNAQGYDAAAS